MGSYNTFDWNNLPTSGTANFRPAGTAPDYYKAVQMPIGGNDWSSYLNNPAWTLSSIGTPSTGFQYAPGNDWQNYFNTQNQQIAANNVNVAQQPGVTYNANPTTATWAPGAQQERAQQTGFAWNSGAANQPAPPASNSAYSAPISGERIPQVSRTPINRDIILASPNSSGGYGDPTRIDPGALGRSGEDLYNPWDTGLSGRGYGGGWGGEPMPEPYTRQYADPVLSGRNSGGYVSSPNITGSTSGGTASQGGTAYGAVGPGNTPQYPYYNPITGMGNQGNYNTGSAGFTPYYYNQGGGIYNNQGNAFWQDSYGNWYTGDKSGAISSISQPPWGLSQGTQYLTGAMQGYAPYNQMASNWNTSMQPYWSQQGQNLTGLAGNQTWNNQVNPMLNQSGQNYATLNDWLTNIYQGGVPGQNAVAGQINPAMQNYSEIMRGPNGNNGLIAGLNQIMTQGPEGQREQEALSKSFATQAQQGGLTPELADAYRRLILQPQQQALQGQVNRMGGGVASVPTINDQGLMTSTGSGALAEILRRGEQSFNDQLLTKGFENQAQLGNTAANIYGNYVGAVSPYFNLAGNVGLGNLTAGTGAMTGIASSVYPYANLMGSTAGQQFGNAAEASNQYLSGLNTGQNLAMQPYTMGLSALSGQGGLAGGMYGADIGAQTSRYGTDIGLQQTQEQIAQQRYQSDLQAEIAKMLGQGMGWGDVLKAFGPAAISAVFGGNTGGTTGGSGGGGGGWNIGNVWSPWTPGFGGGF